MNQRCTYYTQQLTTEYVYRVYIGSLYFVVLSTLRRKENWGRSTVYVHRVILGKQYLAHSLINKSGGEAQIACIGA